MNNLSSRRGAARVSAVWTIVAFVLFFVALGFGYVMSEEAAQAKSDLVEAQNELTANENAVSDEIEKWQNVSAVLGYRESTAVQSSVEAANTGLTELKNALPNTDDVKTFQDIAAAVLRERKAANDRIADLTQQVAAAQSARDDAVASRSTVSSEKDTQIAALNEQLTDLQSRTSSEIASLESRVDDLTNSRQDLDEQLKAEESKSDDLSREIATLTANQQSFRRNVSKARADIAKAAEKPDGEITAVSTELNRAWINLSSSDRLSVGTVFRVTGRDADDVKGFIEVVDVTPTRAEARIIGLTDRYDPMVQGHKIWNELYEAKGQRYAVLAGRFDGVWNEKELRILLDEIGITVQDEIDINTDFLVAGSPTFEENEDGELEEVQVADTADYKDAQNLGLSIVSIRDLEQYFRK